MSVMDVLTMCKIRCMLWATFFHVKATGKKIFKGGGCNNSPGNRRVKSYWRQKYKPVFHRNIYNNSSKTVAILQLRLVCVTDQDTVTYRNLHGLCKSLAPLNFELVYCRFCFAGPLRLRRLIFYIPGGLSHLRCSCSRIALKLWV